MRMHGSIGFSHAIKTVFLTCISRTFQIIHVCKWSSARRIFLVICPEWQCYSVMFRKPPDFKFVQLVLDQQPINRTPPSSLNVWGEALIYLPTIIIMSTNIEMTENESYKPGVKRPTQMTFCTFLQHARGCPIFHKRPGTPVASS